MQLTLEWPSYTYNWKFILLSLKQGINGAGFLPSPLNVCIEDVYFHSGRAGITGAWGGGGGGNVNLISSSLAPIFLYFSLKCHDLSTIMVPYPFLKYPSILNI